MVAGLPRTAIQRAASTRMTATTTRQSTAALTMSAVSITGANAGGACHRLAVGELASDLVLAVDPALLPKGPELVRVATRRPQ